MKKNKTKFKLSAFRKTILVFSFSLLISFLPTHKSSAALWPAIDPIYQRVLDTMYEQLQGIIMGALKQSAAKMINQQVTKLVGGSSSSSAMFITDWEDYLIHQPKNQANTYMNDYLSKITKGKGSSSSYSYNSLGLVLGAYDSKTKEGFSEGKVLGESTGSIASSDNYYETLLDTAKGSTVDKKELYPDYEGSPSKMFSNGNWDKLNSYLSGVNNPWAFDIQAQNKYEQYKEDQRMQYFARSIAYKGYTGTIQNGRVTTPGSTVEQAVANAQDIGNKILAAAKNPGEMISSIVSQIVTQAIQQGIGTVSKMVDEQVSQVTSQVNSTLNSNIEEFGPSSLFNSSSSSSRISY